MLITKPNLTGACRIVAAALATFVAAIVIPAKLALGAAAQDQAFTGARIIDGTGKAPVEKATLLIHSGRIVAIGPAVKIPAGAERIDVAGKTIIPGLINAHGHVNDASQL